MFGNNKPNTTPKDFFLHLGSMAALYISAIALIHLWFQYINILFPDAIHTYYDPYSSAVRWSMASLIVVFPIYLALTRYINKDLRKNKEKKELWIRKWLVYLTLFVAGVTMAVDLIALINTFLGGELTTRFILKVLTVFIVVGSAFYYYIQSLRGIWDKKEKISIVIGWVTGLVVMGSLVAGFFIIGSPQTQRDLRFDRERVNDLQNIQWQVVEYWRNKGELPESMSLLEDDIVGAEVPVDPKTEKAYEYSITGELSFELCADFALPSDDRLPRAGNLERPVPIEPSKAFPDGGDWEHNTGRNCFERTIDPDRFQLRD